ncbi:MULTISPECIES: cysteine--tRNA ligase [Chromobacterium]|uniref:Cysteine--tRNA ligase n=2 Tax=Chromobacterium TaxID=535 RepID=A0ABS3GS21_9NEIS|nr:MULTISPECIES: cysteine--tRNA ligase [Chromobacterium]AXT47578.1 cysteine--tRNA ligase [Chromobacterium rhizoryzae]MBK0416660.1 cysteine--tRNA ligase [Chromobacterium haemolyticum]MBO0417855.1 cysteine--tRNA ligase [Chromobacterium haemolyticum]MBO0501047.1 cysteine--tRNA ligase [Chromobacterium haemolyticum]MDH0343040.1 cysteine--tRNA ligase [Chromobacterium haemolyticum]
MLTVYNTLTRQKEEFKPIEPGKVCMYVCGMTVYDLCHIGHARMLTAFDVIYRWFVASGYDATYVRNITDIEDKIIKRAAERGILPQQLVEETIADMRQDAAALGLLSPTFEPRATQHVPGMVALIEKLIANGKAYAADNGDVYYAVREFEGYGKLSGRTLDKLRAGERVEVDPHKRDPLDFVLWKAAKPGEPSWDSPWGPGRPGWHIECSVMSCHHLGEHFDIHGGGEDLQFPHHENEIAQSEGAHGHQYVNYWLHNGFINVDGEKMSKSLGNFFTIRDVLGHFDGEVIRFFIVRSHYRSPVNYTDSILVDAKHGLTRLYTALRGLELPAAAGIDWKDPFAARFQAAMNDDFNSSEAVAVLFELAGEVNKSRDPRQARLLKDLGGVLGLLQRDPEEFLKGGVGDDELSAEAVEALIQARKDARASKNWAESDRIRDELTAKGIVLEDGAQGTIWRRA